MYLLYIDTSSLVKFFILFYVLAKITVDVLIVLYIRITRYITKNDFERIEFLLYIAKPQTPAGMYFEQFGITEELRRQITTAALSMGGEDCDLYFQHSSSTSVAFSDGKVSRASSSLDLGMGVRVVVGDQVGYSFSEDLTIRLL